MTQPEKSYFRKAERSEHVALGCIVSMFVCVALMVGCQITGWDPNLSLLPGLGLVAALALPALVVFLYLEWRS